MYQLMTQYFTIRLKNGSFARIHDPCSSESCTNYKSPYNLLQHIPQSFRGNCW